MGDSIHKTHFQVPEMPWKRKENNMKIDNKIQRFNRAFQAIEDVVLRANMYSIIIRTTESFATEGIGCIDVGIYEGATQQTENCVFSDIELPSFEDAIISIGEWFLENKK